MVAYIVRRLLVVIPILIGVTIITFFLTTLIPGDVVDVLLDVDTDPVIAERLRETIGLDQSFVVRYWKWFLNILQGDFGYSIIDSAPVFSTIVAKLFPTLELALLATLIGIVVGIPFGVFSAIRQFHFTDDFLRLISLIGFSLPSFWVGTLLILMVSVWFPGFPVLEYVPFSEDPITNLQIMSLPAITLGIAMSAMIVRMSRACVLEVLRQQYVVTARSKGLAERVVLFRHVLRNALLPVVTLIGLRFGFLIGGLVIVEEVFAIPGLGRLVIYSISKRDFPLILGVVFFIALSFMLINLLVDILYAVIDPRISYGKKEG